MKPTRSEVRGTWMLAAVCALSLAAAVIASWCDRPAPMPDALPLPSATASDWSDASQKSDSADLKSAARGRRDGQGKRRAAKTKRPKRQTPDTPSPLDRPV